MTDAYIYVRFSTPRQERGSSKERQLALCEEFAARMGWTLAGEPVCDLGRSAWKADHLKKGNLGKLRQRIDTGDLPRGAIIVVEELDRLSRQKARITQRWIEDVCDAGYKIATAATGKIYDAENLDQNILSMMEILLKAEAAWEYSERLSRRSKGSYKKRLAEAREQNVAVHSVGPAWLRAVGKRPNIAWEQIPERVVLIREMFDLTIAGHAPWAIARQFNSRPNCPSFTGKKWERTSIVKILRNRAVEGDYVVGEGKNQKPTGEVLVGYYPAILPLDVISQARAMLARRRRGSGRNSGAVNNLFGQKIRCGLCGGRMMLMGYQSRYLTCYEAGRGNGCDHTTTYKYRPFERAALDCILHLALDERFFRQAQRSNALSYDIATTEKAILDKQAEAGRAYGLWDRTGSETAERRLHDAEAEMKTLKAKLAELEAKLTLAQGAADAEAHLRRVHGVREALTHPDEEVRLPARLRVSEALQDLIDWVACAPHQLDGQKVITMSALGGAHSIVFDNEGTVCFQVRPSPECDAADFESDPSATTRIARYLQRLRAA